MEKNYNKCFINDHGEVNGPVIIGDDIGKDDFDFIMFSELLDRILVESDNKTERKYAVMAKHYADGKEKNKLKQLIKSNLVTFTSGTFATLAGGVLLEMVKMLLH